MSRIGPFSGDNAATAVALTTTLTSVPTVSAIPGDGETVRVVNACTVPVSVALAPASPVATVTSPYIIAPGTGFNIAVARGTPLWAAAMPIGAASASVYFMRGDGTG